MRSPDERAQERSKHQKHIHSNGLYRFCRFCDSTAEEEWCESCINTPYPCPVIIAMDETDEALAEVENWRRAAENWETWANHHECGGIL